MYKLFFTIKASQKYLYNIENTITGRMPLSCVPEFSVSVNQVDGSHFVFKSKLNITWKLWSDIHYVIQQNEYFLGWPDQYIG